MKKTQKFLVFALTLISYCAYAEYFYMDKTYSDILIKNPIRANLTMSDRKALPPELMKFALTSNNTKSSKLKIASTDILYPSEVITFSNDGKFSYIRLTGPSKTDTVNGKWRVENSTLIFTLPDAKNPSVYPPNSELRYKIIKIADAAETRLSLTGLEYQAVTNIIPTSDNPISDFERITALIAQSEAKNNK